MFNGKALYNPQGRSGEYAKWAINFYNGCTGGCEYCYNKRFPLLSAPKPTLKACLKDEQNAADIACREIAEHKNQILTDGGVFLSFVSDPCLPETIPLTMTVAKLCSCFYQSQIGNKLPIPIILLTKQADWVLDTESENHKWLMSYLSYAEPFKVTPFLWNNVAFGFTLTGHDELEPGCSSNADRIRAMKILHDKGFRTWASIEPVIDFRSSLEMIRACAPFCDHFKVGLRTDKKFECTTNEFVSFVNGIRETVNRTGSTVYFKRSARELVGGGYIIGKNFVEENFDMFKSESPNFI